MNQLGLKVYFCLSPSFSFNLVLEYGKIRKRQFVQKKNVAYRLKEVKPCIMIIRIDQRLLFMVVHQLL